MHTKGKDKEGSWEGAGRGGGAHQKHCPKVAWAAGLVLLQQGLGAERAANGGCCLSPAWLIPSSAPSGVSPALDQRAN